MKMRNNENNTKKPLYKRWWFVVLVIFVFFWAIGSARDNNNSEKVSSTGTSTNAQTSDTATTSNEDDEKKAGQEEKAQKLLDDAKSEFEKANYSKFLDKLNKVSNDYPETEVANSVQDFTQQMLDSTIKISSVDLVQEYKDNEVRADGNYKDKLIIVTGTVDSIGKSVGSVYITLDDGEQFSLASVQCMFKSEDEINKVAELEKGDQITLIGKCVGQTLTNVILSDSYIQE